MEGDEARVFLESVVENIPDMIFVKDAEHLRFVRFNRAGEELLGLSRDALIGKTDHDFFPREQADFFVARDRETLARGAVVEIDEEPIDTARGRRWLRTKKIPIRDGQGRPRYLLGISADITAHKEAETARRAAEEELRRARDELEVRVRERTAELTRANQELQREAEERRRAVQALGVSEAQFRQAQKMEAIGRLAGGIAHDFNNLMTAVMGYGELILLQLSERDPLRKEVLEIKRAGERAAALTRQLLAFSRKQVLDPTVLSLNAVVTDLERMLQRLIGEDVELVTRLDGALENARVDRSQLEQVIVNLAVNSRDAMPDGGKLVLETRNVELDEAYAATHPEVRPGPHVMLAVTDTGTGMTAEVMSHLFEPFFTTKEQGKGTGLGLSTVYGIVKQSGGSISAYSEVGRGTTFKVYLPAIGEAADAARANGSRRLPATTRGHETVLLVEDEELVRSLARTILDLNGYQVLVAANAGEALLLSERHAGTIHLMLTDVVLPQMSGRHLHERLAPSRPGMKVLYMSGYTEGAVVHQGELREGTAFIQKPFTPEALARKVRDVLDGAPA